MRRLVLILVMVAGAARAEVSTPRAECFADPGRWSYDRAKETLAEPGQRFLRDLRACDPTLTASIEEAVRYEIQTKEAEQFRRHQTYVLIAYSVAWGLVALAALAAWVRMRRLRAQLAEAEARVRS